ncbi:acetyl/propionyl/methylcrotonyl-CoA carboxylase subunit alpha [Zafaria sp. J156]|uniref:acetyl/propionyl/methylcrotonyl-CoA carboxylase subunit alpha n=1 Tax=Zafaria sp. J156 TaxID=3116490 RepID=UPI002E77AD3F|nr:biotin carboxylase N-terminal domain-containing protein [Zafaria sp. J156]MEE1620086.1 biotin carboxylase N-terminal domain-containing protein [Zafaria sp. J156]
MTQQLFHTVLVANRGEIAVRVIRTLRRLGITSVAVYSDADAGALHVREADLAVRIGPAAAARSYLDIAAVVEACRATGAQAVHPGYGFLSENVDFARALEDAGIVFIGPDVHSINLMGDKIRSKNHVASHGVPVVPGIAEPGLSDDQLVEAAAGVGYPLLIKPSAGGGGKGMFAVESPEELPAALASARRTARGAFGDDTLFLERLVRSPRHIEVQVLADRHGHTVHLGERECSLQRRHQKVIEEAPSPLLEGLADGPALRERLGAAAVDAARSVGYVGAGTVEFLVSDEEPGEFFFMEMNTRLQVEHPVTEEVVRIGGGRIDLVEWQLRVAAGQELGFGQDEIGLEGHAVEARVYAESPSNGFLPSIGEAFHLEEPSGDGIRVDSSLGTAGWVSEHYDPMIAKVIAWGPGRPEALDRLDRALAATVVLGVETNLEFLRSLVADPDVAAGRLDTTLIDRKGVAPKRAITGSELAVAAARFLADEAGRTPAGGRGGQPGPWDGNDDWRVAGRRCRELLIDTQDGPRTVLRRPAPAGRGEVLEVDGVEHVVAPAAPDGRARVDGRAVRLTVRTTASDGFGDAWVSAEGWSTVVRRPDRRELLHRALSAIERGESAGDPEARSPMPGTVVSVSVATGDHVVAGQQLIGVEAMKMEHPLTAAVSGVVTLHAAVGEQVRKDQVLATVHPDPEPEPDPATAGAAQQTTTTGA